MVDGGGGVKHKQDYSDWKFQTYRSTALAYDIFYEPTSSYNEENEGDNLSGNHLINLQILTTNIDIFCVPIICTGE